MKRLSTQSNKIVRALLTLLSITFTILAVGSFLVGTPDPGFITLATGFVFADIDWDGGDNMGGFTAQAYLGIYNEIDTWPTLAASPSTDEELVSLTGTYTCDEGKSFYQIYVTPRTFGGEAENQGEIDGKSFLQKGEFFYPGTKKEALALARKLNNNRGIIIGVDPNTGNRIQFGSKEFPLFFSPKIMFGKTATDRRGITVEFECDHTHAALIYNQAIPLSSGQVDPIS
jgi:hypothetical protein